MSNLKSSFKSFIRKPNNIAGHLGVSRLFSRKINYIVERKDWAIRWDGIQICKSVNYCAPKIAKVTTLPILKSNSIVHFGSQFLWQEWHRVVRAHNKVVVSFFHGKYGDDGYIDKHIDFFLEHANEIDQIVVPNTLVDKRLKSWGVDKRRITKIPLGVNTEHFKPATRHERNAARQRWHIPEGSIVIGSFQKDGQGWGDGNQAKLIKGPDLFVKIVEKISKNYDVIVLLTGPARGYIKRELERKNIKYRHTYFSDYHQIVQAYHALDCYLMTSREEGGPKSILESAACDIPVIATNIGMAPDVLTGNSKKFLFSPEFSDQAVEIFAKTFESNICDPSIKLDFRALVQNYDWEMIGNRYWESVYKPMIQELT